LIIRIKENVGYVNFFLEIMVMCWDFVDVGGVIFKCKLFLREVD